jgi:pSer/pThr/pTyr-binding forkhead associated (FHA) protein
MPLMNLHLCAEETWPALPPSPNQRLVLTWGAHRVEVNRRRPSLSVGRGALNGIVIRDDKVSRHHARIDFGYLGFLLVDLSTNGTFIANSAGKTHRVRNDTHVLTGAGTISFGADPATGEPHLVRYAVTP